jgi:hypothetical protein
MERIRSGIVNAVRVAESRLRPIAAKIGTCRAPQLLYDAREPYIKHDELVALSCTDGESGQQVGVVVQWNCHPETLGNRNYLLSADFVGYTVEQLRESFRCPVLYLTGTVGGLMTSLHVPILDANGQTLADGTFAKTEAYGRAIGRLADKALAAGKSIQLSPMRAEWRGVYVPLYNPLYKLARQTGVLDREGYLWAGDSNRGIPAGSAEFTKPVAVRTEIAWLRLGELEIAAIPGEIYPELVLGKVQDPPDPGADFPGAPVEPAIYACMAGPYRMLVGLANDELGYIIPKRQWDEKPPYCYGRKEPQYGEANSVGPDTAPILCAAFRDLVAASK